LYTILAVSIVFRYGAVAANYLLGLAVVPDPTFRAYCLLGALAWSSAAVVAVLIAREGGAQRRAVDSRLL